MPDPDLPRALPTVEVTGPLTRDEVARWHQVFAERLTGSRGLRIDLAMSGPWDLAGVQLLLAVIASARLTGRPIVLSRVPGVLAVVARRAELMGQLEACVAE